VTCDLQGTYKFGGKPDETEIGEQKAPETVKRHHELERKKKVSSVQFSEIPRRRRTVSRRAFSKLLINIPLVRVSRAGLLSLVSTIFLVEERDSSHVVSRDQDREMRSDDTEVRRSGVRRYSALFSFLRVAMLASLHCSSLTNSLPSKCAIHQILRHQSQRQKRQNNREKSV
jgi:hypothetical protein